MRTPRPVQATHEGYVAVTARLAGGRLRLMVADTGVGLSTSAEKSLWQEDASSKW